MIGPNNPDTTRGWTDNEWAIHAINIHGIFFEKWCQQIISETPGWSLDSVNYPVEFPPPNGPIRGKESTLDIRASSGDAENKLSLLIECKKNNPDFINWIFFSRRRQSTGDSPFHQQIVQNIVREQPGVGWNTSSAIGNPGLDPDMPLADEGRETRADYATFKSSGKTKTSNAAIQDAAYQIALATQAVVHEDSLVMRSLGNRGNPPALPWKRKVYVPMIVTSAQLFVCEFDPKSVMPERGELGLDKARLTRTDLVAFEYSLPRHLQFGPANLASTFGEGLLDRFTRMHILVLQSRNLPEFLRALGERSGRAVSVQAGGGSTEPK